ncbi:MAG TPA: glycosyltransferase family 2 protein [Candidatus Limnocylindria bacterium]|nr:glycosyltransferase family 2 protein [Candidatus Limnocylindria bacterium]
MKLIIQIPCYNEEAELGRALADLPKTLPGIDVIETLVIDDGSTDGTAEVARSAGATYLLRMPIHLGLAQAFSSGLDAALKLGADVIVNTDADRQYPGDQIGALIAPILAGRADMVIGDRAPHRSQHFGLAKRWLQRVGSWAVRQLSGTQVPDAASGFRAFSRRAALKLNVLTRFTYTLETIIQAGKKNIAVSHVPIRTNPETRPSRLFGSIATYLRHSMATMVRIYAMYEPLRVFGALGALGIGAGMLIGLRFVIDYFTEGGEGHIQSLILAAVLVIVGFQTVLIGLLADLIAGSRALVEDSLFRVREIELRLGEGPEVERLGAPADPPRTHARSS